jgi:uncharacterized protein YaeQ
MALKSTIHKANLQLADIDHGVYTDLALTIARHPSETEQRMMVRLVAMALHAHAVQTLCQGDAQIQFGAGLSDPDDPDVHVSDFTGRKRVWIEVGQPEDKPLVRASGRTDSVAVYAFGPAAEVWWRGIENKVVRLEKLSVWRLPSDAVAELDVLVERSMNLQASVQDGALTLSNDRAAVVIEPVRWK